MHVTPADYLIKRTGAFFPVAARRSHKRGLADKRGLGRSGYTLVEILVATFLTLILMTAVVTVFGGVGDGIAKSRRAMEQFDRQRTAVQQFRQDIASITVPMDGRAVRPETAMGYLEYIESGSGSITSPYGVNPQPINSLTNAADLTVGQCHDIIMFTARNAVRPFVGRYLNAQGQLTVIQSDVAEVAWFLRGTTLHRRVLLIAPGVAAQNPNFGQNPSTFFQYNDISVRLVNGQLVPNSLADLTKRENRFAHPAAAYPFDVRAWGILGLPTLAECSSQTWMSNWKNGTTPAPNTSGTPAIPTKITQLDYWDNTNIVSKFFPTPPPVGTPQPQLDLYLNSPGGNSGQPDPGTRLADDVVLTNVIGFDVKVWEPALNPPNNNSAGYVDLGYLNASGNAYQLKNYVVRTITPLPPAIEPRFQHNGIYPGATLAGSLAADQTNGPPQRVYDSGCFGYENEGLYNIGNNGVPQPTAPGGTSTNGFADSPPNSVGDGIVDHMSEWISCPPYPVPLRGIQVKIRCFEPDSRQIREMTIVQDFLPK
jgi:type II secretory pathway pseudopilin PulG